MKNVAFSALVLGLISACGQAATPAPAAPTQAATLTSARAPAPDNEKGVEKADKGEEPTQMPVDAKGVLPAPVEPLTETSIAAMDPIGRMDTSRLPKIEQTPKKELKKKSRRDLDAALALGQHATNVDQAAASMTKLIGKPTWIEQDGKKRVWIVTEGARCHKLTLDQGGELDLEVAPSTEWHMLSVGARQNVCSGEVRAGIVGGE